MSGGEVEAAVGAAFHHAWKLAAHRIRAEVAHGQPDAAVGRGTPGAHFGEHRTADDVARGALAGSIMVEQKAAAVAIQNVPAGAAQALFQHRPGHARIRAGQQPGRVKLHHLHVTQTQSEAQRHCQPIHRFVAGRGVVAIHRRPATGRQQCRGGADAMHFAAAHVHEQCAAQPAAVARRQQCECAMLFENLHRQFARLLHQTVHDFDAGQIAFVHGAVKALAGERLLVQCAVVVAVEEAAVFIFQLADAQRRGFAQPPCEFLMRQPLAAFDGVAKMQFH